MFLFLAMNEVKLKAWVHAARLRTLPLALSGILLGSFLAYADGILNTAVLVLAILTTLLLQILSNFANDYGDYKHGTDNENRVGPKRAVQSGAISAMQMKIAMLITALLAFTCGIALLFVALSGLISITFFIFLIIGILAIAAAIKYTVGASNYGYKGLGDIMVFLFFGIAAVWGTFFLHTFSTKLIVLLPASAVGLLSAGVLNLNNMRDAENDKASGKITLAVKLGKTKSKNYHALLITLPIIFTFIFLMLQHNFMGIILILIPSSVLAKHLMKVLQNKEPKLLDPELKRLSLTTLLFSVLLGIGVIL